MMSLGDSDPSATQNVGCLPSTKALAYLRDAAELETVGTRHRYVYAIALHDLGQPREAIAQLQALLRKAPNDPNVLLALANYNAELGQREKALGYARTLTELAPRELTLLASCSRRSLIRHRAELEKAGWFTLIRDDQNQVGYLVDGCDTESQLNNDQVTQSHNPCDTESQPQPPCDSVSLDELSGCDSVSFPCDSVSHPSTRYPTWF